jgi:hypothetical protein
MLEQDVSLDITPAWITREIRRRNSSQTIVISKSKSTSHELLKSRRLKRLPTRSGDPAGELELRRSPAVDPAELQPMMEK